MGSYSCRHTIRDHREEDNNTRNIEGRQSEYDIETVSNRLQKSGVLKIALLDPNLAFSLGNGSIQPKLLPLKQANESSDKNKVYEKR